MLQNYDMCFMEDIVKIKILFFDSYFYCLFVA